MVQHRVLLMQGSYFPVEHHQPKVKQDREEGMMVNQMLECHKSIFYLATLSSIWRENPSCRVLLKRQERRDMTQLENQNQKEKANGG